MFIKDFIHFFNNKMAFLKNFGKGSWRYVAKPLLAIAIAGAAVYGSYKLIKDNYFPEPEPETQITVEIPEFDSYIAEFSEKGKPVQVYRWTGTKNGPRIIPLSDYVEENKDNSKKIKNLKLEQVVLDKEGNICPITGKIKVQQYEPVCKQQEKTTPAKKTETLSKNYITPAQLESRTNDLVNQINKSNSNLTNQINEHNLNLAQLSEDIYKLRNEIKDYSDKQQEIKTPLKSEPTTAAKESELKPEPSKNSETIPEKPPLISPLENSITPVNLDKSVRLARHCYNPVLMETCIEIEWYNGKKQTFNRIFNECQLINNSPIKKVSLPSEDYNNDGIEDLIIEWQDGEKTYLAGVDNESTRLDSRNKPKLYVNPSELERKE